MPHRRNAAWLQRELIFSRDVELIRIRNWLIVGWFHLELDGRRQSDARQSIAVTSDPRSALLNSALDDVQCKSREARFLVPRLHIEAGLVHRLDYLVQRNLVFF